MKSQRKIIARLKAKNEKILSTTTALSPMTKFKNTIENSDLPPNVKKQVILDHSVTSGLKSSYKNLTLAERKVLKKTVCRDLME